ncbi:MAG: Aminoglycoside N(6)-acetyltransferase type 1 [Ramlibacter sp.]|nr:Aminoglycoside N(6)-acetyltransferase type 1 [Ramlibacter sp.]
MSVIQACIADDVGWLQLRQALWPGDESDQLREMRAFCAEPRRYGNFIARSAGGEPQGFVEVALRRDHVNGTDSSPVAFLEGLYVAPAHRRHGVARALVACTEQWAREQGCSEFASDALLQNTASHAMHGALGFDETERVVYFRKRL